jgi:NadR type nicotinamide-nucleotide adenylyltransferase
MKTIRIAITGPESTGKTSIAEALARHYSCPLNPEYAREYLAKKKAGYTYTDVEEIARRQVENENELLSHAPHLYISDTDLLVIKIWMEHKYGKCSPWISDWIEDHPYDLYLLCNIDVPWVEDPQREHPHLRAYFFGLYLEELSRHQFNYVIISGNMDKRITRALSTIDALLPNASF